MRRSRFLALALLPGLLAVACAGETGGDTATTTSLAPATVDDADATTRSTTAPSEATTIAPSGSGSDMPDPCGLLTVDDVVTATGLAVGEGVFNEELSSDLQVVCDWIGTEEFAFVQVLIIGADTFDTSRASADEVVGVTDVEIPGVSSAFVDTAGSMIGMAVDRGYLQVSYLPGGPGTVLEETTQLATIAAANLG